MKSFAFFRDIPDLFDQDKESIARYIDDYDESLDFLQDLKQRVDKKLSYENKFNFKVHYS
jgi:hypothetical protein